MIPRQFVITTSILFVLAMAMSIYVWELRHREISMWLRHPPDLASA